MKNLLGAPSVHIAVRNIDNYDIILFKMCQWTSGRLYIVNVLYRSAEQYLVDIANVSDG